MRMSSLAVDMHGASYCPRLFTLHELEPQHGNEDEFGNIVLPEKVKIIEQNAFQGCKFPEKCFQGLL